MRSIFEGHGEEHHRCAGQQGRLRLDQLRSLNRRRSRRNGSRNPLNLHRKVATETELSNGIS
jgi:hypothetical protein